jgi:ribosomal protein L39E
MDAVAELRQNARIPAKIIRKTEKKILYKREKRRYHKTTHLLSGF